MVYRESLLAEIQLAITSKQSKFISFSDSFSHYIYELKRSMFGPISELCNIWRRHDELRAKYYLDYFHKTNVRMKKPETGEKERSKCIHRMAIEKYPYKCQECKYYVLNPIRSGEKCKDCKYKTCHHCKFDSYPEERKKKLCPSFWRVNQEE